MDGELVQLAPATALPKPKGLKGTAKKLYQVVGTEFASKGFLDIYMEIKMLYPTNEDAYEMLEAQHERITGKWMYAEYGTFRRVYKRWLKKQKRPPK